jgi:NAD(P)-dependent dehydrogenase (short-subunit alcohol dehydrogenase family)
MSDQKDVFNLQGRCVFVSGAASGIGAESARVLAHQGAKVILADINQEGLEREVAQLSAEHSVFGVCLDQGNKQSVLDAVEKALTWAGRIDCLVCCGGMEGHVGSLQDVTDEDWHKLMTVNLQSALWLSNALIPQMPQTGEGRLIYVASIAALRGNGAIGAYGIAKAGLVQLARNMAVEHGKRGITANAVAPGLIHTPFAEVLMKNDAFMEKRLAATPLRRVGKPHEVAGVVSMLASPAGGFINGQTIVVDGGTTISDGS